MRGQTKTSQTQTQVAQILYQHKLLYMQKFLDKDTNIQNTALLTTLFHIYMRRL